MQTHTKCCKDKFFTIYYAGTYADWQAIDKANDWDKGLDGTTLVCTDASYVQSKNGSWQKQ